MKNHFEDFGGEEAKLRLLREIDSARFWESLDDRRHCVLCEETISGRQIRISWNRRGIPSLHCPTPGCRSSPAEWVHPENPLTSEDAWKDWVRLLESLCEEGGPARNKPLRRFRPSHKAPAASRLAE